MRVFKKKLPEVSAIQLLSRKTKFERNHSKAPGIQESTQRAEPADGGKGIPRDQKIDNNLLMK